MSERFLITAAPVDGHVELDGDEARHLVRVMRAQVGDDVVVFDGRGTHWPAQIIGIDRHQVRLEVGHPVSPVAVPGPSLTLAVALPKGERQKWLVEKLTELGVDRLVPLVTERGVVQAKESALERLGRTVIEACKQCGRDLLMEITAPATIRELAAQAAEATLLVADPRGESVADSLRQLPQEVVVAVGPEGGLTATEMSAAKDLGFGPVALASNMLRVETAAIAAAALIRGSTASDRS